MSRTYATEKLAVLALLLLFAGTGIAAAQTPAKPALQAPSGLTGKVVDLEGNVVAGFTFAIQPMQLRDGQLQPEGEFQRPVQKLPEDRDGPGIPRTAVRAWADSDGNFTVTDIQPGFVHLEVLPNLPVDVVEMLNAVYGAGKVRQAGEIPPELRQLGKLEPDKKIVSIQIGKVIFFNTAEEPGFFEGLTFALKPGVTLENVKITVKPRLRIHARIVYADGTPLTNADGRLNMRQRDEVNPNSSGSYGLHFVTDADGYFTQYMDVPGFYTFSVKYNGLSAGAGPFLLKDNLHPEKLVLTLEGKPLITEPPPDNIEAPEHPAQPQARVPAKSVWVINPTNGHAYKKISCESWHDAQQKAVAEGAHLVSINDEAEQHWLQGVFRIHSAWIGLTDVEKEGEWQWDSGEPVTYTNWVTREIFPDRLADTEKDYAVFTFRDGEWQPIGPGSHFWRTTREALLEKDGLVSTYGNR